MGRLTEFNTGFQLAQADSWKATKKHLIIFGIRSRSPLLLLQVLFNYFAVFILLVVNRNRKRGCSSSGSIESKIYLIWFPGLSSIQILRQGHCRSSLHAINFDSWQTSQLHSTIIKLVESRFSHQRRLNLFDISYSITTIDWLSFMKLNTFMFHVPISLFLSRIRNTRNVSIFSSLYFQINTFPVEWQFRAFFRLKSKSEFIFHIRHCKGRELSIANQSTCDFPKLHYFLF